MEGFWKLIKHGWAQNAKDRITTDGALQQLEHLVKKNGDGDSEPPPVPTPVSIKQDEAKQAQKAEAEALKAEKGCQGQCFTK
tara:strand:- start:23212 stop:23457 length:246 start_codon:yes stop_codon:yes gene_type:complete